MQIHSDIWHRLHDIPMFNNSFVLHPEDIDDGSAAIQLIVLNKGMHHDQITFSDDTVNAKVDLRILAQVRFERGQSWFCPVCDYRIVLNQSLGDKPLEGSPRLLFLKTEIVKIGYYLLRKHLQKS